MMIGLELDTDVCQRAASARDPRFDGVFFIGVTTTRVYCRPVCPARVTYPERRRFFASAAAAEQAGFRPCLRCRPELAPGRAHCDAVSRLAGVAAQRIAAGALNGRSVADLARDLQVSERHLRRSLEREFGASPVDLAQTHRLLLAKQLLADTNLSVTRVAYASGFQSLRRFNATFRERYRMPPSRLRQTRNAPTAQGGVVPDSLRLSLGYRPPLAWAALLQMLRGSTTPSVEHFDGTRYLRTVRMSGASGVVSVECAADAVPADAQLRVDLSITLLPALMPLLARLRQLLDLDAQPSVVDAHLARSGLAALVAHRPGVRVPGAIDGFEVAMRLLLGSRGAAVATARRIATDLGEPIETRIPQLTRLMPTAERIADAGAVRLVQLGASRRGAEAIAAIARLVAEGTLRLEPAADLQATSETLREVVGLDNDLTASIVMRALHWPDACPASSRTLRDVACRDALRPWRAYAAAHLALEEAVGKESGRSRITRRTSQYRSNGSPTAEGVGSSIMVHARENII